MDEISYNCAIVDVLLTYCMMNVNNIYIYISSDMI